MAKVSINIIKDWFKNQMKPPQEQFWAWLDSFWHKDEPIPQSAVNNLVSNLLKKADLIDGVVPEEQLPFSVVTSEVITLGLVELIGNKTYLRVHSSGANKVRVKGKLMTRTFQNQWTITPIVADGVKVLRGYAVKNNDDFLLAEGAELPTYVEPEIPEDALEIFKITMRSSGNVIEQTETGLKYIAEDGWRNILLTEDLTVLPYNFDLKSSYWINTRVANPVIGGIHNGVIDRNASPTWDGKEFWLFNNTGGDLLLDPANVTAIDVFLFSDKLMPLTVKNNNAVLLKLKDNVIEIMRGGGGGASFPASGNDGDLLQKDSTIEGGIKWTDSSSLGKNISNANLIWAADRTQNLSTRKLTFTNGRFSLPTLELEVTSANSVPNKIWNDNFNIYFTDNSGVNNNISGDVKTKQFIVSLPATVQENWKGCIVFFTGTGVLTVPSTLSTDFSFDGAVLSGLLTWAINSPKTWFFGTPRNVGVSDIFNLSNRGNTNSILVLGL